MSVCTFFGHREIFGNIEPKLKTVLTNLIEKENVTIFYVGNHGAFDRLVKKVLKDMKKIYPHISYAVVLAYMPTSKQEEMEESVFPEGLENTPPKYAIIKRNEWMLNEAQYVVSFVKDGQGGAAFFQEKAMKKGKTVINIAENQKM